MALPDPIITWRTSDNSASMSTWTVNDTNGGTVDAGVTPPSATAKTILVWNNYASGGTENTDVKDAYNLRIISTDVNGNVNATDTPELIQNDWILIKCNSLSETTATAIGRDNSNPSLPIYHPISAVGTTTNTAGTFTVATPNPTDNTTYKLLGCKNTGATSNLANFSNITLSASIPTNATGGNYSFLVKCLYLHV